jgi:DNA-binding beta-propeller fold protein YncE
MNKMSILRQIVFFILLVILYTSCSSNISKVSADNIIIYPAPPEPTRIQYLTSYSSSTDVTGEQSDVIEYIAGESESLGIIKPYGISVVKGKIYIVDTIIGGIMIMNLKDESFELLQPKGLGQFKKPINCFKEEDGKLYVVDAERTQVLVFDSLDTYLTAFGEDVLIRPTDVFVKDSLIFVSDIKDGNVKVFSKDDYSLIRVIGDNSLGDKNRIYQPTNIYVKNGKVYVSDFGDFKIKIYSIDGELQDTVGSYGRNIGQFVRPKGISVDDSLNLYVVDAAFENVQIFNKDGELLMFFGGTYKDPGDMWLPAKVVIDYNNMEYFQKYVYEGFNLKYLIFVSNQYGPDKINVYGFVEEKKY